jgi:hypothetical protein
MSRKKRDRKGRDREIRPVLNELALKLNLDPLVARIVGLNVIEILSPFTVMLAFTKTENPGATDVFNNGTGSLVDTGQRKLLVTNHHVYEEFEKWRSEVPCTRLVMSGVDGRPFVDISGQPCIDSDESYDLAVLAISPAIVEQQGKKFYPASAWPPQRPKEGTRVVIVGYPGQGRHAQESDTLVVMPLSVGRTVTSVSDRHFLMADETQDAYTHAPEGQRLPTSYGGISGSAAYSVHRIRNRSDEYHLCGFVKAEGFDHTILVAHADHINADGTIR